MKKIIYQDSMAYGYVIPKESPDTFEYLENVRDYNSRSSDIKKQIKISNEIYRWEGQVSTTLDMLCEFGTTKMNIYNLRDKTKDVINWWLENLNKSSENIETGIHPLNKQNGIQWFVDGNALIYKDWQKVKTPFGTFELPANLLPINPINIDIPDGALEMGSKYYVYKPPDKVTEILTKKGKLTETEKIIVSSIPKSFMKAFDKKEGKAVFTNKEIYHIKRKGRNYLAWGIPYLTKVFNAVASKRKLQALDNATTEGLINSVRIYKIGNPDHPETFKPARIAAFASLIQNPTNSLTLVWSFDVEIEESAPNEAILDFADKYNQVNQDILEGMGIPVSILRGESRGDPYVAIAALMERLQDYRDSQEAFLDTLLKEIGERNKSLKIENPIIGWGRSRLINERQFRELILTLYDRGVLSRTTTIREAGFDIDKEIELRKEEDDGDGKTLVPYDLPFSGKEKTPGPVNDGQPRKDTKTKKDKPDVKDNQKSSDEAKGQVYGILEQYFGDVLGKVQNARTVAKASVAARIIPERVPVFVKTLMDTDKDLGLSVDKILGEKAQKLNENFKKDLNSLDKVKKVSDFKKEFEKILNRYAVELSLEIERSMK